MEIQSFNHNWSLQYLERQITTMITNIKDRIARGDTDEQLSHLRKELWTAERKVRNLKLTNSKSLV